MVDEGLLELGYESFKVFIRFDAAKVVEQARQGLPTDPPANLDLARAHEQLLLDLHALDPELKLRIGLDDRGTPLRGAFAPPPDVIRILETVFQFLGAWVTLATVGGHVKKMVDWLAERYGDDLQLSDGAAIVVAAAHLYETYGLTDVTFWFVTPIDSDSLRDDNRDGHLVGFRDSEHFHLMAVDARGKTTRLGPPITLADMPPGWGIPTDPPQLQDPAYWDDDDEEGDDDEA